MDHPTPTPAEITLILHEWQGGSREALDRLMPIVYNELRTLASRQLAREWRHDRMQTTAVVNEAYMKLFGQREVDWQNRGHFFAIAAQIMRRIVVDHARRELRAKRGRGAVHMELTDAVEAPSEPSLDVIDALALDQALQKLEALDPDQGRDRGDAVLWRAHHRRSRAPPWACRRRRSSANGRWPKATSTGS